MRAGVPLALNRFRGRAQHLKKAGQEIFTGTHAGHIERNTVESRR